jgi:hypothetical protein
MLTQIVEGHFKDYPPEAKRVAVEHIRQLQELPPGFVPLLLQQIHDYDWRFPSERREIEQQLAYLASLPGDERRRLLAGFEQLKLSSNLKRVEWVSAPGSFSEKLSAYLWSTHQIDAFRQAASSFLDRVRATQQPERLPVPRLGIAVIGQGVEHNRHPLFRKLRPIGTYFTQINPANGLRILLDTAAARAEAHPVPFGHWYVDGGTEEAISTSSLLRISYAALEPARMGLLQRIDKAVHNGIGGPEPLFTALHRLRPEEIGLADAPRDAVMSHFQTSLRTEGSGTQIFSTTFVQWTTRELWRRAQPLTILARFAPRQRQRPMNELLSAELRNPESDPTGSLIDADMAAFYMWIDQQRLSGAKEASFLAWFENHGEAVAMSPTLPRNTESDTRMDMRGLLAQIP